MSILARHRRSYLLLGSGILAVVILVLALTWPHPNVQPKVNVTYTNSTPSTIAGFSPHPGSLFLAIHMTVENDGYQNFTANPIRDMYVIVNGQSHNVSLFAYSFLPNPFPSLDLKNTQSATGDMVFEVPQGSTNFTPGWRVPSGIQLDWLGG